MKKLLSVWLCLLIVISLLPVVTPPAQAAETPDHLWEYTVIGGEARIDKYKGNELYELEVPSRVGVGYFVTQIGNSAFQFKSMCVVILPTTVTSIGDYAFYHCEDLTEIRGGGNIASIGKGAFSGCTSLESFTIPEGVPEIGRDAFYDCAKLEEVTIPASVGSIADYAFSGCGKLMFVNYGGSAAQWNGTPIGSGNDSLTQAAIRYASGPIMATGICGETGDNVTWTLDNTGKLTVSGTGRMRDRVMFETPPTPEYAWYPVKDLIMSAVIGSGVTNVGSGAFYDLTNLTSVEIPSGVTEIGDNAFNSCSSLTNVTIPEGVTVLGKGAFFACTDLTDVSIPASVTSIGFGAFTYCDLSSVVIPAGVTVIAGRTFEWCSELTSVTIPASVTRIEERAFLECRKLTDVYYGGTEAQWAAIDIGELNSALGPGRATIHYSFGVPVITTQPVSVTAAPGTKAYFTVTATGTGLTYQWQYSTNGSTWYDTSLTGYNTPTLTVTASTTVNGRYYRCVVSSTTGSVTSGAAKLTVATTAKPVITGQPANVTAAPGTKAYFTVTATGTGLTYQWQYSVNGTSWNNTSLTGYNTKTLTVTASTTVNGRYYRCIVTNAAGSVTSNSAKLTVASAAKPVITGQPANVAAAPGTKAYFTVTATGTGLTYQWQYSVNGTSWNNTSLTGYNTKTLTVTASTTVNGRYYRCIVTNAAGSVTSNAAKLTVASAAKPIITGQPANVTAAPGTKANFTVTATGTGLTYQWQYSVNGTSWNNTSLTGYNTKTLTVTASTTVNGRYYRCIVTNAAGSVTSNAAKLTVLAKPVITGQPVSATVAPGTKAYFTVTATGTGLTYQWQYSVNGTSWNNTSLTGYNTPTLTVTASAAVNGRYYRCIVTNAAGSVTSDSAKIMLS